LTRRSRGKTVNRKILCFHTLSTLCSIDFELRHIFSGADVARAAARPPNTGIFRSANASIDAFELKSKPPAQFPESRA
jgi:hypothetical protein